MYTEFLAATIEAQGVIAEDRIAEAFDRLDSDGTGYISKEDLFSIMGDEYGVEGIIESVDMNKDGQISYQEFLAAFRHQTELVVDKALKVNDDAKNV
jgi:calcium-dependent protein kinase